MKMLYKWLLSLCMAITFHSFGMLNFQEKLRDLQKIFSTLNEDISTLQPNQEDLQDKLSKLHNKLSSVNQELNTLQQMASAHKQELAKQKASTTATIAPSKTKSSEYSINLMWVNRDVNKNQRYIYPAQDEESLYKNFLDHIFKWASVSKGGVVNLWFDGALISEDAVKNTQQLIEKKASENPQMAPIILNDLRQFPEVKDNPKIFDASRKPEIKFPMNQIPVYFRVDLMRAIAAYHALTEGKTKYFVYADLDMEPLTKEQLFDQETLDYLKKYGTVMARGGHLGFENGFFIISNHNKNLLEALKFLIIDLNVARAYKALENDFYTRDHTQPAGPFKPLEQVVYDSYVPMFEYFYQLEGYGSLKFRYEEPEEKYTKNKHGLEPFGVTMFKGKDVLVFQDETTDKFYEKNGKRSQRIVFVPTKKVELPPSLVH